MFVLRISKLAKNLSKLQLTIGRGVILRARTLFHFYLWEWKILKRLAHETSSGTTNSW